MRMITCLCLFAYSGVQHILCCGFFSLSSFCFLCTQYCQFLRIAHSCLSVQYSLTFIVQREKIYCHQWRKNSYPSGVPPVCIQMGVCFRCSVLQIIGHYAFWGRRGLVVVMVWQLDVLLPMQLVPITTNIVSSNPAQARCTRYHIM